MANDSQTELDLDKISKQELLDNINAKQNIIVYLINNATLVNQALAGIYASRQLDADALKLHIDTLNTTIQTAASHANELTDKLLRYKKEE